MHPNALWAAPPLVLVHLTAAVMAVVLAAVVLIGRKGTPAHRRIGRAWVGAMAVAAGSAAFIHENPQLGPFSAIHLLIVVTAVGLVRGLRAIRRGDVAGHARSMTNLVGLALLGAGAFTLVPGRRMADLAFGPGAGWGASLALMAPILALAAAVIAWGHRKAAAIGRRDRRGAVPQTATP